MTRSRWWRHAYVQVLAAIVLGVLVGHFAPVTGEALKPLGDAFIKLVKMIIAPVIVLTIVTGIAGLRDLAGRGPEMPDRNPERDRHHHLDIEVPIPGAGRG